MGCLVFKHSIIQFAWPMCSSAMNDGRSKWYLPVRHATALQLVCTEPSARQCGIISQKQSTFIWLFSYFTSASLTAAISHQEELANPWALSANIKMWTAKSLQGDCQRHQIAARNLTFTDDTLSRSQQAWDNVTGIFIFKNLSLWPVTCV